MNEKQLQRELVNTALAAEKQGVVRLPSKFHSVSRRRRGEIAAWVVQRLVHEAADGEPGAVGFWRRRGRPHRPPADAAGKPKVALFSPGLRMGGAERWIIDLAKYLDRNRVHVAGIGVRHWDCNGPLLAKATQITSVMIGDEACQHLVCDADAMIFWGTHRMPIGSPKHSVYVSHGTGPFAERLATLVASKQVKVAAVSHWASQVFPIRYDVAVIHNGVDAERLEPRLGREEMRTKWGLEADQIAVGYVGRFSYEKNPAAAAQAVHELGGPYRAVYIGDGQPEVRDFLKRLKPEPIFIPPMEEIGDAYAALDCFILASRSEGFSLALTEAWMCGVPTVTTPVGAVPELEEQFGRLSVSVPIEPSERELAEAIRRALSKENRTTVEHARTVTRKHFTARAMGLRWTDYMLDMIAKG